MTTTCSARIETRETWVSPYVRYGIRMLFFPIMNAQYAYVFMPYVYRTSTSLYDENKLKCVSYLQAKLHTYIPKNFMMTKRIKLTQ